MWALFVGVAMLMTGNGLQGALLGVRAEREGFGLTVTGIIMTCYFIGFLFGAQGAVKAVARVGHIRVFAGLASLASTAVLVHALVVTPISWGVMRLVSGACMAGLYVVIESWLNDMSTNATRGRILSIYMVASMGGYMIGSLLIDAADVDGFALFIVSSIMVSMSLVPVALSTTHVPPVRPPERSTVRQLAKIVPTGLMVSFLIGIVAGTLLGLGAVFAANQGLSTSRIGAFLAAPIVGAVVWQFPVGWVSDHAPRRTVMVSLAVLGALMSGLLLTTDPANNETLAYMFVLGGCVFPLYSLAIAYTNDWLPPESITPASAVLIRVNGGGAILGPVLTALLMAQLDPMSFYWVMLGALSAIAAYVLYRIMVVGSIPVERQRQYAPFPARGSTVAAGLLPRRRRKSSPPPLPASTTDPTGQAG
ncbi:MAG: MFS transporter [Acidimicrobiales bacterium]|nr:MFS transporter [Acidimicrobiales bacterium]